MTESPKGVAAAAIAAVAAAAAIPIPLAQLDFAGLIDVFDIDAGDTPRGVLLLAAVGGVTTAGVIAVALAGAALALAAAPAGRIVLAAAAVAGFVTALPLWLPIGVLLGAAAVLAPSSGRNPPAGASA
jgi:hypothetical protein